MKSASLELSGASLPVLRGSALGERATGVPSGSAHGNRAGVSSGELMNRRPMKPPPPYSAFSRQGMPSAKHLE